MTAPLPDAPVLATERLTLRPPRMDDWEAYRAFMAGPGGYWMGGPYDAAGAWKCFAMDTAGWALMGHGGLFVELAATGETVGQVWIMNPPHWPQEELGWLLYEGHEGRGYATEAAAALRDCYYRNHPRPVRLISAVHTENAASHALAERLGAVVDPEGVAPYENHTVYRHAEPAARA